MLGRSRNILRRIPSGSVRGAEVGIYKGEMSAELLFGHRQLFLYMVDSWADQWQQPAAYRATRDSHAHVALREQERYMARAIQVTAFASERRQVLRMTSAEAAAAIQAGSLDFVFLDGDHSYEGVIADVAAWLPVLKPGGLLSGHDYCPGYGPDKRYDFKVIDAVDALVAKHGWTLELDEDSCWFVRP